MTPLHPPCRPDPPEEDVARGLDQPLAGHHPAAAGRPPARPDVRLKNRGLRLLHLEEQGIGARHDRAAGRPTHGCRRSRPRRPFGSPSTRRNGSRRLAAVGRRGRAVGADPPRGQGAAAACRRRRPGRAPRAGRPAEGQRQDAMLPVDECGELEAPACCPWTARWPASLMIRSSPRVSLAAVLGEHLLHVQVGVPDRRGSFIPANFRIASRYAADPFDPHTRRPSRSLLARRDLEAAASRFTSHSQGPGSVSSKSLTSKTRRRSGEKEEAEVNEAGRHRRPGPSARNGGLLARSAAMTAAAPR